VRTNFIKIAGGGPLRRLRLLPLTARSLAQATRSLYEFVFLLVGLLTGVR
jgi:hypothetical protein